MSRTIRKVVTEVLPAPVITSDNEAHVDLILPTLLHTVLMRKQQGYVLTQDDADNILDNAITLANQVILRRAK